MQLSWMERELLQFSPAAAELAGLAIELDQFYTRLEESDPERANAAPAEPGAGQPP